MSGTFQRPDEGFRFNFGGLRTSDVPDALPPEKYNFAQNIRSTRQESVRTRFGQTLKFSTGGNPITDIRAYTQLFTDNQPRYLARDSHDAIWLDNGVQVGSLFGGLAPEGVSMIPFRPNASPAPYMYIADGIDYEKFSAPTIANAVTQSKVGIAEPQTPPGASLFACLSTDITSMVPSWTAAGTGGSLTTGNRITDTAGVAIADPDAPIGTGLFSLQVNSSPAYSRFMQAHIPAALYTLFDVFPALNATINIAAIFYYSGSTGKCVIVLSNASGTGPGVDEQSIYDANLLGTLRPGALIQFSGGGSEICRVYSVTTGPGGAVCFETFTTNNHTTAETVTGIQAIGVFGQLNGQVITSSTVNFQVTVGVGTATGTPSSNPFSNGFAQPDDYLHISLYVDNLTNLNEIKLLFDVGDGSFTQNFYYYTIRPSDIQAGVANSVTQLAAAQTVAQRATIDEETAAMSANQGVTYSSSQTTPGSGQWSEILVPISEFTRVGSDQTESLVTMNAVQVLVNANATVNVEFGGITIIGGHQPDVGDIGAPYQYRVRPRSSVTGVKGNPSPAMRYGVNPRRCSVNVSLPSASYDSQIDTWDIFRYGGSVTSWRFIGSTPSSNSSFRDDFDDSAANAGDPLEFDNFEPWPSVAQPLSLTANVVGTTAFITNGAALSLASAGNGGLLPGTLVQLGGLNVYTLWTRPVFIGGGSFSYLLQFVEDAGSGTSVPVAIQEPLIANQPQPYMWGPDATGTVFAVGDQLRPGSVSFCKNYAPDQCPDKYNIEITAPSEPLINGEILDGLSFVASSARWWAMYPQQDNPAQRYSLIQQPFVRGLAAPWGHCNDGATIYWWAPDSIQSSKDGSLTDADLFNLFPHDGVPGSNHVYNGQTVYSPDYSRAATFRLSYSNGYLYATYQDTSGTYRCLVCDLKRKAWSVDAYSPAVSVLYHPEQPAGTLTSAVPARYDELIMGTIDGRVATQTDLANDLGGGIAGILASFEWDGGDVRAPCQWGDVFLDSVPAAKGAQVSATYTSAGASILFQPVPQSAVRVRQALTAGLNPLVSDFMGLMFQWTDDYTQQSVATQFNLWQPSVALQPAYTISWTTFGSSFGIDGYMHVRQLLLAYVSTDSITLFITSYDGQSPQTIFIPSSGGQYVKTLFPFTPNKGLLYKFTATSGAQFQIFLDDSELFVGAWRRDGNYLIARDFGVHPQASSPI